MQRIKALIADVPDFPKPGIIFKDITPILLDPQAAAAVTEALLAIARARQATKIAGIESRGFIFGAPLAQRLGAGFVPLRKPGKLPRKSRRATFAKEYGEDSIEMHDDACGPGDRVLVVDDLLATGGTAEAAGRLVREAGAEVAGFLFVVELKFLDGRQKLTGAPVDALIAY
ncbi:MAG: adenine phosphoribosyltransferase [Deltaproteobacteria bacterium]|nr:adenine phosphoribosyltransferase [Deltaproteobacteria bacterium]